MCENYSRVVGWCEGDEVVGRTNQALVSSIELLLHDYRVLVCQLGKHHLQYLLTIRSKHNFHAEMS